TLQIACIGYEKYILKNISVSPSSNTTNDVKLIAAEKFLKEVVVVSNNATIVSQDKMESINSAPLGTVGYSYTWSTGNSKEEDFNTEEYGKINDNEFKEAKRNPLSTFSIDVDRASYSNVRRFITQGSLPPADAVRVEEMINYFSYNYPQPEGDAPFSITTEYTECPWNKKHNLIHIGMQGKQVKLDNMPANNLVFLIDVSGSMDSPDKLPLLKSGLRLLVEQMRPQDKIAIVVYAGNAGTVLPSTSGNNKDKIIEALDNLEAGGSTAGGEGIILAYKTAKENFLTNGNNRVILATDGDFNVGVSSDGELTRMIEKKREDGIFLTVLGFGTGNIKDSKMEQLADKGNGNYAYVDNLLEAKKVLVKEMGGTLLTIAKDVKLQIEFNPSKVKGYRLVGYENRLLNNEDFNDDKKDAGELGSGHTVTAIYEIIPAGSSEEIASVDSLKYQQNIKSTMTNSDEVMTIKFRYKEPKENTSKLISKVVLDKKTPISMASENCRFSSCVAEFGMLLRDSKFKGESNYKNIMAMAKESKGKDDEGYRAEFIKLVEMAELLKK
ncbi:MAG: vWA domain-containing protein, partial [Bacteroidia bacterium]